MTKLHGEGQREGRGELTFDTVVELLTMLDGSQLPTRIVYENGPVRLEVERGTSAPATAAAAFAPAAPAPVAPVTATPGTAPTPQPTATTIVAGPAPDPTATAPGDPVTAPIAGIFYRAPNPDAAPFVEVGQQVSADDVIGIVEVMKLMNSVRAGITGTVVEVCAQNAELVEYGQVLVRIEPGAQS
jgi:acetyl-CoA carboxylase biotin carboxyl carrier protein